MSKSKKPSEPDTVSCKVCMDEIPISEAMSEEAVDYVLHFCGLECYAKWEKQEKTSE